MVLSIRFLTRSLIIINIFDLILDKLIQVFTLQGSKI